MRRDGWIQIGAAGTLVLCLAASAFLTTRVAASAGRNHLSYADTAEKGDPPEVTAGIAMGAFRGLFVNMLWMRANALKEEGKYYEAVDLAKMITKLQPRFPRVWVFHAWNLAYNISVATTTEAERWQWVQAGIRLLRDEGIPANPDDVMLHKELAWIFLHKVQGIMDDANWYYKRQLAHDWTIVLGPPPRRSEEIKTTDDMKNAFVEWLQRVADAKDTLEELIAADPKVGDMVQRLRDEAGLDLTGAIWTPQGNGPGEQILTMIEELKNFQRVQEALNLPGFKLNLDAKVPQIILDPASQPAAQALVRFIRKRLVVDKYHMELDRMIRYTKEYGPLDWRHPATHAIYWSSRGVEEVMFRINPQNKGDYDILNTDRLTIQALQELFRDGQIYFDNFNPDFYMQMPNPDFIDSYDAVLTKLSARAQFSPRPGEWVDTEKVRPWSQYAAGYENFMKDVVRFMYRRGDRERAEYYYTKLRTFSHLAGNRAIEEYVVDLAETVDQFAANEITKENRETSPYVAQQEIYGAIEGAYLDGLLVGNTKLFQSQMNYARAFHKIYVDKQVFNVAVNRDERARMEVIDRDFDLYAARVLVVLVQSAGFPDGPIIYRRCTDAIKTKAYPLLMQTDLRLRLDAAEKAGKNGFDVWFPPPPGLENYRKELEAQERAKKENKGTIEQK